MNSWSERIAANVAHVSERIVAASNRAGRTADSVTLIAVSKTVPAEAIRAGYAAGLRHFGENRVQERESKRPALGDLPDAVWHLIGGLQSNKARRAAKLFQRIDSVDSEVLARRLHQAIVESARQADETQPAAGAYSCESFRLPILLEVLLAPEESKRGIQPEDLLRVAEAALSLPHLELRGLMCIPPFAENPEDARPYFRRLAQARDKLSRAVGVALPILSMGMSHDFEVAIEEGATEVRVGTAVFGERPTRPAPAAGARP